MFKAGDKVTCVDNIGIEKYISLNKVYTIIGLNEYYAGVIDDGGCENYFYDDRFELVNPSKNKKILLL